MHPRIMAEKDSAAQMRIAAAIKTLAERFGVEANGIEAINTSHRDPALALLFQHEALADVLDDLAARVEAFVAPVQLPPTPPKSGKDKKTK